MSSILLCELVPDMDGPYSKNPGDCLASWEALQGATTENLDEQYYPTESSCKFNSPNPTTFDSTQTTVHYSE